MIADLGKTKLLNSLKVIIIFVAPCGKGFVVL